MNLDKTIAKLQTYLKNPTKRTLEENAPLIRLKNGRNVMIMINLGRYYVSEDFGATCVQRLVTCDIAEVAKLLIGMNMAK